MATEWFYTSSGQKAGPVSSKELKRLATQGVLLPTDLLWKEGMKDWLPASKAKNLFADESSGIGGDPAGQQPLPQDSLPTSEPANATEAPVTLGARMQNAARATALKAEQAKLTNVSLPAAYVALGRHLYAGRLFALRFPELYRKLDNLQAQIAAATKKGAEATGANLSEKAKALATKATELGKVKAAEVQQLAVFKQLGQVASEEDALESLPRQQLSDLVAIRERLSSIQDTLASTAEFPLAASGVGTSGSGSRSPWTKRAKWIGGVLAALCLIAFVSRDPKHSGSQDNDEASAASNGSTASDESNPDFAEGYQAGQESMSLSPQEKGLFFSSLEQQIPSKADPKAFRRGMAKAFKEANAASDAESSDSQQVAKKSSDTPKSGTASGVYARATKKLRNSGLKNWGESPSSLSELAGTFEGVGTAVKAASLWHKSNGEDDQVVLLVELEPAAPSDQAFNNAITTRLKLRGFLQACSGLMLYMVRDKPDLAESLQFGMANGERYVKTMSNGSTTWLVVWVLGTEIAELNCTGLEYRTSPSSSGSGTTLTYGDLHTTCGVETFEDSRPSTIGQIKRLLCGGK